MGYRHVFFIVKSESKIAKFKKKIEKIISFNLFDNLLRYFS